MRERVFVDANVLFTRTLRDWIFLLRFHSHGQMSTLGSTEDVLAETIARLRDERPDVPGAVISRLRAQIVTSLDEMIDYFMRRHGNADLTGHLRAAGCLNFAERINLHCHALLN